MIAATNRLKEYPTRIVYREVPERDERLSVPMFWVALGTAGVVVWVLAIIGIGTVVSWIT